MAATDASVLQGRNGWQLVEAGQTFAGRSAGFQVLATDVEVNATCLPIGTNGANTLTAEPILAGQFIGGTITSVSPSLGNILVYPLDADYTIT